MTQTIRLSTVALFALILGFGAVGAATAGDGKSCGDKKKGDTAVLVTPALPQA